MPLPTSLLLATQLAGAAPVRPSAGETIEVHWRAPTPCPDESTILAQIERYIGQPLSEIAERRLTIIATARLEESRWSLTIFTITAEGTQERTLRYAQCSLLGDAAAVLIAMAIDPKLVGRLDPETLERMAPDTSTEIEATPESPVYPARDRVFERSNSETPPVTPPPATSSAPVVGSPLLPARRRLVPHGAARLAGSLGFGDLPSVGGGLNLALALEVVRFRTEVVGGFWSLRPGSQNSVFDLWTIALRAGYVAYIGSRVELPLLLGAESGQLHVYIRDDPADNARGLWVAATASPSLAVALRPYLALVVGVDVVVPLRSAFIYRNDREIFEPRPVAVRAALGLEFRFPRRKKTS